MKAQDIVAQAVEDRGYYQKKDGTYWRESQLAARQVAKLTEELGELLESIAAEFQGSTRITTPFEGLLKSAARVARRAFDSEWAWRHSVVRDPDAAASELADVQVVVYTMADALGVDVEQLAIDKATKDVARGRR